MGYRGLDIIKGELDELESFILKNVSSSQPLISSAVNDLTAAGGKRIRPALTILIGRALGYKKEKLIPVAASMEIIHMATLVHDDIIDDAMLRRGKPTVQSKYGKDIAVFTGDYLFSKAFLTISQYADKERIKSFADAVKRICEGEIEQYENRYNGDVSVLKYLRRIRRKTGVLLALSCMAGAIGKRVNKRLISNLGYYGMDLGLAFQINDDILDFVGDEKTVGKPVCNDIRQGIYTLPLIYAIKHTDRKEELLNLMKKREYNDDDIDNMTEIVKLSGGIDFSKKLAQRYVTRGIRCVEPLKNTKYKEALKELIINLNNRDY